MPLPMNTIPRPAELTATESNSSGAAHSPAASGRRVGRAVASLLGGVVGLGGAGALWAPPTTVGLLMVSGIVTACTLVTLSVLLIVTALYASEPYSARAFRLLPWARPTPAEANNIVGGIGDTGPAAPT
jgi:hypothetical protein